MHKIAVEKTRLGIPLIIALDVIHCQITLLPAPLAESASWDLKAIEQSFLLILTKVKGSLN